MRRLGRLRAVTMAVGAAALMAGVMAFAPTPASAAPILNTTTTLTSEANPAFADGGTVKLTANVKILNLNLGPITPKGTVTFSVDGVPQQTVPLSSCIILLTQCTASFSMAKPDLPTTEWYDDAEVTARYNGDALAKPSTGTLVQEFTGPRGCSSDFSCSHDVTSADGSARLVVSTGGDPFGNNDPYEIQISFSSVPSSCSRANTGNGAVFNVTYPRFKFITFTTYDQAAVTANQQPNRICWAADSPFETASGAQSAFVAASGMYEGLLPQCSVEGPVPCVDQSDFVPAQPPGCDCDPRARLTTDILAPEGDPKATR